MSLINFTTLTILIVLCEVFASRGNFLNKQFKFNPRKCNSVISFSSCVHRDKSKCCIAIPTSSAIVKLLRKTPIGGVSCVNTRLALDSQILFPKDKVNLKLIYKLEVNGTKENKRTVTKKLKMDENNQYGNCMTKPSPYGCIKKNRKKYLLVQNLTLFLTTFHMRTKSVIFFLLILRFME